MRQKSSRVKLAYLQIEGSNRWISFPYKGILKEWLTLDRLGEIVLVEHTSLWFHFAGVNLTQIIWLHENCIQVTNSSHANQLRGAPELIIWVKS